MPDNFVDLILTDPPYGETGNKWDKHIDFKAWFVELERILKPTGAIVFTSSTLLASKLIPLAPHLYKYDWVWQKDNGTNVVSANHQPLRVHELILVFGKQAVTYTPRKQYMKYNPQKTKGKAYKQVSGRQSSNWKGGKVEGFETINTGDRHPVTIQKFNRDRGLHPKECERLQGFPDDWTALGVNKGTPIDERFELISDTQRYKMCGNAVTTNVVENVMKGLTPCLTRIV